MEVDKLNDITLDVLKELGNIGAGSAATALANMLSAKVDMKVPNVRVLEFKDVANILGGEENLIVGIYFEMRQDLVGNMMFALDIPSAKNLTNLLYSRTKNDEELDDMDISILSEVGNILSGSYANALSTLTGMDIFISVPSISIDMAGAILSVPAIQFGHMGDHALMIETVFEGNDQLVSGNFFLLPDMGSFDKILKVLGVV